METISKNQGFLHGRAGGAPSLSHANHGIDYYIFPLEVERLSGSLDILNVVLSEELLADCPVQPGEDYLVTGEVRSFNNRSGVGSRLVINGTNNTASAIVPVLSVSNYENEIEVSLPANSTISLQLYPIVLAGLAVLISGGAGASLMIVRLS